MSSVSENLSEVNNRIVKAAERAGRDPSEITLVSVSKTKPYDKIQEAIDAGAVDFVMNGQNFGKLGGDGDVVDRNFTR